VGAAAVVDTHMRGITYPLGHLVSDDAYALALSELLLREGAPTEEVEVV
jgi:hypothetical protein